MLPFCYHANPAIASQQGTDMFLQVREMPDLNPGLQIVSLVRYTIEPPILFRVEYVDSTPNTFFEFEYICENSGKIEIALGNLRSKNSRDCPIKFAFEIN